MIGKYVISDGSDLHWVDTPEDPVIFESHQEASHVADMLSKETPHLQFFVCHIVGLIGPRKVSRTFNNLEAAE